MNTPAAFRACYSDWKLIRTRSCVQVVFEVPLESADAAYAALGGMPNPAAEVWFGIARLKTDKVSDGAKEAATRPDKTDVAASRAHKPVDPSKRLAQRAGILSGNDLFHKWWNENAPIGAGPITDKEEAANAIREYCRVESRADIIPGSEAATRFDLLESAFVCWRDRDQFVEQST